MRFGTRTFLSSFLPVAVLLTSSFWAIQKKVEWSVRDGIRSSMRENQISLTRMRSHLELHSSRLLNVVGENASLKAGLQLLLAERLNEQARVTVEDQLRELCEPLNFDFLQISDRDGNPLVGMIRDKGIFKPLDRAQLYAPSPGLSTLRGSVYQIASVPINQGQENLGTLSMGEHFYIAEINIPSVLVHHGNILQSNVPLLSAAQIEPALKDCNHRPECELKLQGETYLSLAVESTYLGDGYSIRSLQNLDAATRPLQQILRNVFLVACLGAIAATSILSFFSSQAISKPLALMVTHLRQSESTGLVPEFQSNSGSIQEIRDLTRSFNRAAAAIRGGKEDLQRAYLEFTESLASALDARDPYTAGHSKRVSGYCCDVANAMNVPTALLHHLRIGALLHDIGKIGIADAVLQKPGKFTPAELNAIQQHPTIGRRILESVQAFEPYLQTIELHHENWDGTGYPHGLRGEGIPFAARVVHVTDAYDAMTTDRPYRRGASHEHAIRVLRGGAGTQFDPALVTVFVDLLEERWQPALYAVEHAI